MQASKVAPPSVPLCLAALFKSLTLDDGGPCRLNFRDGLVSGDPKASKQLDKAAAAAAALVAGLSALRGMGPLADTAATPKSLKGLGRCISACSFELRAMCEEPPAGSASPPAAAPAADPAAVSLALAAATGASGPATVVSKAEESSMLALAGEGAGVPTARTQRQ